MCVKTRMDSQWYVLPVLPRYTAYEYTHPSVDTHNIYMSGYYNMALRCFIEGTQLQLSTVGVNTTPNLLVPTRLVRIPYTTPRHKAVLYVRSVLK